MTTSRHLVAITSEKTTQFYLADLDHTMTKTAQNISGTKVKFGKDTEDTELAVEFVNYIEDNFDTLTLPINIPQSTLVTIHIGA